MWQLLLISITVAVSTSPLTAQLTSSCEKFGSLQVCKDSSGALSSVHNSDDSKWLLINPTELGISSIGPAAFENPTTTQLIISSVRSEYNMNEGIDQWLCTPSVINVTSESFHGLPSVVEVTVACVELQGPQNIFNNLTSMEELTLFGNKFTEFPQQLCADIPTLEVLRVSEQQIETLSPASFAGISGGIKELFLNSNGLKSIEPNTLAEFRHLKTLDLSNNSLEILGPELFDGLDELTEVNLSRNRLRAIPTGTFSQLENLKKLHLAKNHLEILDSEIFLNVRNLEYLSLEGNAIRSVSRRLLRRLHKLQDLSLGFHESVQIEPTAFRGMKLYDFRLNADELTNLAAGTFSGLSTGRLNLHRNKAINFEPDLFEGLTITFGIYIYEAEMSKWIPLDRLHWGVAKNVMILSEQGRNGTYHYEQADIS